jgi:hypothetical protein
VLGLGLDVATLVLAFDVATVVVALAVAVLGLGLEFDVEVQPATSNGAVTRTTAIKSRYFFTFTFHPFRIISEVTKQQASALN